jgi:phosphatidate cytidylyltransferase
MVDNVAPQDDPPRVEPSRLPVAPPPGGPEKREMSNLARRIVTAAFLIPPVLWVCYVGGFPFVSVVVAFVALGINEFYDFISAKGARPHRLLGTLAAAAVPLVVWLGSAFVATSLMTAFLLGVMILQLRKGEVSEAIASVSETFFGVFYVGWLLSHAVSIRLIDRQLHTWGIEADVQLGFFYMVFCLATAVMCDAGAFFVGRKFGKRRLAPAISPGKTVEGALGGIAAGVLGGLLTKGIFEAFVPGDLARDLTLPAAFLMGLVVSGAAIVGDLIESLLKRDAHLKDAGWLLPGMGGVLDRLDSALLAIPVTYYLLVAFYYAVYVA